MIAPAWPMRRPGGAVWPAMKPTTGFLKLAWIQAAASCSADPPISPIITTASVWASLGKQLERVDEAGADQRVAADADAGGLAEPELGELVNGFVGQRAALGHDADAALGADVPGDDAGLGLPRGDQARAVRADEARRLALHEAQRLHRVEHRDALGDADDELDAGVGGFHDGVGGKRRRHEDHRGIGAGLRDRVGDGVEDREALVLGAALAGRHAADDVGAIGRGGLGVEGPFAAGEALDDEAGRLVDQYSHGSVRDPLARESDDLVGRLAHRVGRGEVESALAQHGLALLHVGAFHADDDRHRHTEFLDRGDDAGGEHVAAQDAAEDVDQHRLHVRVRHQDPEGVLDLLGVGAAADVEEVGRLATRQLDDVHRRHRQPGAVDHAADRAVEADVVQRELARLDLERIFLGEVAQVAELLRACRARCRRRSPWRRAR